jgi:hypothetical protein
MRHPQGTAHCDIVFQSIRLALLQARRRPGLHDTANIRDQLTDTGSDFTRADANHHALGVALRVDVAIDRCRGRRVVRTRVRSPFCSSACHRVGGVGVVLLVESLALS